MTATNFDELPLEGGSLSSLHHSTAAALISQAVPGKWFENAKWLCLYDGQLKNGRDD
jgi:hypothetical protein